MLLYLAVGIVVVLAIVLGVVASQPADFKIERSTTIAAPPEKIFGYVNDLHQWTHWSPWEKLDPNLSREYTGPASGVGASYAWSGNNKVGQGKMTITDSQLPKLVQIRLEFLMPFQATNMSEFAFTSQGAGTHVNWSMTGHNNFMGKLFGLLMNMDKMVGKDFEKGLASLKTVSEAA